MPWQKTDILLRKRLNQHGLGVLVAAGALCHQAEALYPEQFRAISVRSGILHLTLPESKLLAFKMIEGKLLEELNHYAEVHKLPLISRIRLTIGT